jgi:hypothetical protein
MNHDTPSPFRGNIAKVLSISLITYLFRCQTCIESFLSWVELHYQLSGDIFSSIRSLLYIQGLASHLVFFLLLDRCSVPKRDFYCIAVDSIPWVAQLLKVFHRAVFSWDGRLLLGGM